MPAGLKFFQPVDGWQIAKGIVKAHQFPLDQVPVTGRTYEAKVLDRLLSSGVGQRITGAIGQDEAFRQLQPRVSGIEMIKPAPNGSRGDA